VSITDDVDERKQDMKAGLQCGVILTEALDDASSLLRHDDGRFDDDNDNHDHEHGNND
jgi:hypothetical protein